MPWLQPTVENRVMDFLSLLPMAMSRVLATLALVSSISRFMSQPWEVGPVSVLVWGEKTEAKEPSREQGVSPRLYIAIGTMPPAASVSPLDPKCQMLTSPFMVILRPMGGDGVCIRKLGGVYREV